MDNNIHSDEEKSKKTSIKDSTGEILRHSKEKIKDFREKAQKSLADTTNTNSYAAFAYVPIIGPLIVYIFKRSQAISVENALNATYTQGTFITIWFALWLLENIPVISSLLRAILFIPNITNALMYLNVVGFLGITIYGAIEGGQGRIFRTPFLFDFIDIKILKHETRSTPYK